MTDLRDELRNILGSKFFVQQQVDENTIIDNGTEIEEALAIAEIKELLPKKRTDKDNFIDAKNKHSKESVDLIHLGFNRCLDQIGGLL